MGDKIKRLVQYTAMDGQNKRMAEHKAERCIGRFCDWQTLGRHIQLF
jgi:hypothetical protein